jgi:hypothetical protein
LRLLEEKNGQKKVEIKNLVIYQIVEKEGDIL